MSYPPKVFDPAQFDIKNVQFGTPRVNDNGGKMIGLLYNDPEDGLVRPCIKTPELSNIFGLSIFEDADRKTTIAVSHQMTTEKGMEFFNLFTAFDDLCIDHARANSKPFFKKECSDEVLADKRTPIVKYSTDKETGEINTKYAPTTKFKLPRNKTTGEITTTIWTHEKTKLESAEGEQALLVKGTQVRLLVEPSVFWVTNGKFGLSWNANQIRIGKQTTIRECVFDSESDGEDGDAVEGVAGEDVAVESDDDDIAEICNDANELAVEDDSAPKKRGRKKKN